ncbi:MAG: 30S ribosomal protein S6 [Planctomycetota bacterium]|jgi:small subunit ribosomal protein S6
MTEKKLYEAMFLVDSAEAASDWDGINAAVKKILDRAQAEIVSIRKWDDRRLAYDIRGVSRGTYLLCYFRADGGQIQSIEKAVQLSEKIIRVLILSTEQMTQDDIEKDTPATKVEKEKEKAIAEQPQQAEEIQQDDQEQAPAAEDALITEQAQPAGDFGQIEETEGPEEIEKKEEEAGQPENIEAEEPQDSEPKIVSDD